MTACSLSWEALKKKMSDTIMYDLWSSSISCIISMYYKQSEACVPDLVKHSQFSDAIQRASIISGEVWSISSTELLSLLVLGSNIFILRMKVCGNRLYKKNENTFSITSKLIRKFFFVCLDWLVELEQPGLILFFLYFLVKILYCKIEFYRDKYLKYIKLTLSIFIDKIKTTSSVCFINSEKWSGSPVISNKW